MNAENDPSTERADDTDAAACNTCGGPVREKGGTTGENNLSPGAADRTGGASAGVREDDPSQERAKKLTPDP